MWIFDLRVKQKKFPVMGKGIVGKLFPCPSGAGTPGPASKILSQMNAVDPEHF